MQTKKENLLQSFITSKKKKNQQKTSNLKRLKKASIKKALL